MKLEKNYDKSACGLAKIRSSHSLDFVIYDSSRMNLLFVFEDDLHGMYLNRFCPNIHVLV